MEPLTPDEILIIVKSLDTVRDDVGYVERILAESNAKITGLWAYIQMKLNKYHDGVCHEMLFVIH